MSPYKDALTSSPDLTISSGDALGFMNIITRSQRGGGSCCNYTNNGEYVNVTSILCNTCVNVRIMIRLPNTMKVFMSLNTFEWIYKLQFLEKSNKLHRMHGLFDWLGKMYSTYCSLMIHVSRGYYNVLINIQ